MGLQVVVPTEGQIFREMRGACAVHGCGGESCILWKHGPFAVKRDHADERQLVLFLVPSPFPLIITKLLTLGTIPPLMIGEVVATDAVVMNHRARVRRTRRTCIILF